MGRVLIASDLEGVFIPELWPIIGQRLGLPELSATTRDTPDFRTLMRTRLEALQRNHVTFSMMSGALRDVKPFKGVEETLFKLSEIPDVNCAIITDSFVEFVDIVLKNRYGWELFANSFKMSHDVIESCVFDVGGRKAEVVKKIKSQAETLIAVGDSMNDVEMLRAARFKILFNPVTTLRGVFLDSITCNSIESLVDIIHKLI